MSAKRFTVVIVLVALAGIGGYCAYWFGIMSGWWNPITRPMSVSRTANLVVCGFESAEWFDCRYDRARDVDVCKAWDTSGKLLADGDFRLKGENRAALPEELHPSGIGGMTATGLTDTIYLYDPHGAWIVKELVLVSSEVPRDNTENPKR